MTDWVRLLGTDELTNGSGKAVRAGEFVVAVFKVEGKFYALENKCLHRQGPLGEGEIEDSTVICPWHGWRYDLATGSLKLIPTLKVGSYETQVRGTDVYMKVPEGDSGKVGSISP